MVSAVQRNYFTTKEQSVECLDLNISTISGLIGQTEFEKYISFLKNVK